MISGVFRTTFIVHHGHPRFKLDVPKEGSFPIPLKNIDVVRRTNKTLDVLLESRTDDNWNVDGVRELSGPWTRLTHFTIFYEKLPNGYTWFGGVLQKFRQHPVPIICGQKFGQLCRKALNKKKKRHWAIENRPTNG